MKFCETCGTLVSLKSAGGPVRHLMPGSREGFCTGTRTREPIIVSEMLEYYGDRSRWAEIKKDRLERYRKEKKEKKDIGRIHVPMTRSSGLKT